jgi:glycerophosphoryl diester phosphodiesterase
MDGVCLKTLGGILTCVCLCALLARCQDPGLLSAHRGGSGEYDENTMAAFRASYEAGLRGFETDVHFTSDHEMIIIHDSTLTTTTTSSGTVENMTAAQLALVRTKQGNPLPFLGDLLDYFSDKPVYIELEMKTSDTSLYPAPVLTNYCQKLYSDSVAKLTNHAVVVYSSFDARAVQIMKSLFSSARTEYIGGGCTTSFINSTLALNANQISCVITDSTRTLIQTAQAAGLTVVGYPVSNLKDYLLAMGLGCDVICTDVPVALVTNVAANSVATQITGVSAYSLGDYLWSGRVNGAWDTATANWLAGGYANAYASNSRSTARFDDTAATQSVTLVGALWADAVVFSNATDYTLAGSKLAHAGSFVKAGAGELKIVGAAHTFTGDMLIAGGTLTVGADNDVKDVAYGPLGNPRAVRTITVTNGATLNLLNKNPFGAGTSGTPILAELRVVHASLNVTSNFSFNVGPVVFDDATVRYYGGFAGGSRQWGTILFFSNVTFRGTSPYVFNTNGANCFFAFGKHSPSTVVVEDITGNANPDVTFSLPLNDIPHASATVLDGVTTSFIKTGAGTLLLSNTVSTFSGTIDVAAGVLEAFGGNSATNVAKGALGNPQTNRQIRVRSGATLSLRTSDVMGQLSSVIKCGIAVSNATLKLTSGTCNGFGPLTLYNATLSYAAGSSGSRLWGVLGFGGKTVFDGTSAYAFPPNGSACVFNLGYALNAVKLSDKLIAGQTELEVRDITGSSEPDATFSVPLQDIPDWNSGGNVFYRCGLLKSGAGTLRLAGANTYSGDTVVSQGVLRVDGTVTNSPIAVASGGALAGTGTVASVTLAAGGRFEAFAGQTLPLNVGSLTLADGARVVVRNPTGLARTALNVPFLRVSVAEKDAVGAAAWTATVEDDGASADLAVHIDDSGVVYARWPALGAVIMIQ